MAGKVTTRKKLFDENKRYWDTCDYSNENGYICVIHTLPWHLEWGMIMGVIAKGIQEKEKLPVVGISIGSTFDSFKEGDESFGFMGVTCDLENDYVKTFDNDRLLEKIVDDCYGNKDAILNFKYRDIQCGDSLWETLMGYSPYLDCTKVEKHVFMYVIKQVLVTVDLAYEMFEKYLPRYLMIDEPVRLAGIYPLVAARMGAEIVLSRFEYANNPIVLCTKSFSTQALFDKEARLRIGSVKNIEEKIEEGQYVCELSDEVDSSFCVNNGNKNVFIMLHVFTDAPREACNHYIYRDYLEWFIDTMDIIKDIHNVNWIIRDHPYATGNIQRKLVEEIVNKYENENIIWCEDSVKRKNIEECADVVITYCGTAGLEYWAKGKPTITLAGNYYTERGISYCMSSRDEYVEALNNIYRFEKPNEESIKVAKDIMSRLTAKFSQEDELADLFSRVHGKEIIGIKYERRNYDLYEYEFCVGYLKLLQNDKIRTSECYLLNHMVKELEGN